MVGTKAKSRTTKKLKKASTAPKFDSSTIDTDWPSERKRVVRRRLLAWYDRHKRDLPWRQRVGDGYAQLLAEFMLQQTQVATVIDYYNRFLDRFPTIRALAAAELDDVLALWSGLGYYRRARNLHAAARQVVDEHEGVVPADVESLMKLPGVGRYTAGAIASVAYDTPAPILDGNVSRVLMRVDAVPGDPQSPTVRDRLWRTAEILVPRKRAGDFNQALMELGATVCTPKGPNCLLCPLRNDCRATLEGKTNHIPPPAKRAKVTAARLVVAVVRSGDHLLFTQRPDHGLWAGLWELPSEPFEGDAQQTAARARLEQRLPIRCTLADTPVGTVERQLTHRRMTFVVYAETRTRRNREAGLDGRHGDPNGRPYRWVEPADLPTLGISNACRAVLDLLKWPDKVESAPISKWGRKTT